MELKGLLTISNEEAVKRVKSLAWRAGMMILALVVDFAIQNLTAFNIPDSLSVIIGLILGEISKQLNGNYQILKGIKELK